MRRIHKEMSVPPSVGAQSTIARAYLLMKEFERRNLPVLSGSRMVGVICREDIKRALSAQARAAEADSAAKPELLVRNFMSCPIKEVSGKEALSSLLKIFLSEGVAAVFFRDGHDEKALLTRDDLLRVFGHLSDRGHIDLDAALASCGIGYGGFSVDKFLASAKQA